MEQPAMQHALLGRPASTGELGHGRDPSASLAPLLPAALSIAGGALAAMGALGTWVRTTTLPPGGDPVHTEAVLGRAEGAGPLLLVLGILAVALGFGWTSPREQLRAAAALATVAVLAVGGGTLLAIDGRARRLVEAAGGDPAFEAYHAGFGWGAWLLLVGAVASALALLAGGLRALDRKRGR